MSQQTILHTIETGGPGGAETVLLNLAGGVDAARYRSLVLLPCEGWLADSVRKLRIPVSIARRDRHPIGELVRLVKREQVDLIHSHLPDANFYSCVAGRVAGAKVIATWHNLPRSIGPWSWKRSIKESVVRHSADAVVGVSGAVVDALKAEGFSGRRTVCIYNGVNTARFGRSSPGKLRLELGCGADVPIVGMVANLRASKNYEGFLEAAAMVGREFPASQFVAAGEIDSGISGRLRQLCASYGLEQRFHLLGLRHDIPELLADFNVFVLSSTTEGFSIATIEAMAAGRAVVVTRSGGPAEIVEHGQTGLIVPPRDAPALARGIVQMLADPQRAAELGRNARVAVEKRFSLAAMIARYEQLYSSCLRTDAPVPAIQVAGGETR